MCIQLRLFQNTLCTLNYLPGMEPTGCTFIQLACIFVQWVAKPVPITVRPFQPVLQLRPHCLVEIAPVAHHQVLGGRNSCFSRGGGIWEICGSRCTETASWVFAQAAITASMAGRRWGVSCLSPKAALVSPGCPRGWRHQNPLIFGHGLQLG